MTGRLLTNIAWGVRAGVMMALGLSALAAVPVLFILVLVLLTYLSQWTGIAASFFVPETAAGWRVLLVFPLYLAAGVAAGTFIGVVRPILRWRLGATLAGMVAGTMFYWAMGPVVAQFTELRALSLEHLWLSVGLGSMAGGGTAFMIWGDEHRLRRPSPR